MGRDWGLEEAEPIEQVEKALAEGIRFKPSKDRVSEEELGGFRESAARHQAVKARLSGLLADRIENDPERRRTVPVTLRRLTIQPSPMDYYGNSGKPTRGRLVGPFSAEVHCDQP